ncbi:hypothetical protein C8E01_104302 [Pontibacter virosus]|uniref:Uncharacterized protein n=1 Tax=Pontibacter virosus TaxID=1765052 RepID=A0A2U1AZS1_9BACT|nr:hypothetical protein C8E01_104302 [Pontibacter virosus]
MVERDGFRTMINEQGVPDVGGQAYKLKQGVN